MNSLTVIMPAYNEEKNLEDTFLRTKKTLEYFGIDHEFIIVDDQSSDRTMEAAQKILMAHPNVRFYRHGTNQGIGAAFRTGLRYAQLDYILLLPSDNPLETEDLKPYLKHLGRYDIIAGEREQRTGYQPLFRFLSYAYNRILIRCLFKLPLSDVNWIQMYRRDMFTQGGITIDCSGIFFLTEILVKAQRKGYSMVGVPAVMKPRLYGTPSIYRFSVIWKTLRDLLVFSLSKRSRRS